MKRPVYLIDSEKSVNLPGNLPIEIAKNSDFFPSYVVLWAPFFVDNDVGRNISPHVSAKKKRARSTT